MSDRVEEEVKTLSFIRVPHRKMALPIPLLRLFYTLGQYGLFTTSFLIILLALIYIYVRAKQIPELTKQVSDALASSSSSQSTSNSQSKYPLKEITSVEQFNSLTPQERKSYLKLKKIEMKEAALQRFLEKKTQSRKSPGDTPSSLKKNQ